MITPSPEAEDRELNQRVQMSAPDVMPQWSHEWQMLPTILYDYEGMTIIEFRWNESNHAWELRTDRKAFDDPDAEVAQRRFVDEQLRCLESQLGLANNGSPQDGSALPTGR